MKLKRCVLISLLLLAAGCGGDKGKAVSQAEFGEAWPLTVLSGRVSCVHFAGGPQIVTFISHDRKEYALNITAKDSGKFFPIEGISKPNPTNPSAKKNIGVLIDEALKLCPQ
jgi:hypothetical protein